MKDISQILKRSVQFMNFKRIVLSDLIFLVIILLLTILSIFSYNRIITLNRQSDYVTHTNLVKLNLEQILSYVKGAESGQRAFLITKDTIHLEPYFEAITTHKALMRNLDSLLRENIDQQRDFRMLQWLVSKRMQRFQSLMQVSQMRPESVNVLMNEGKIIMDQLKSLVTKMIQAEDRSLKKNIQKKQYSAFITPLYSLLLSVLAIFAVALSYFFLRTETRLRFDAQDSIKKLNDYFKDLPAAFSIVKGPNHVFEMANNSFHDITGNRTLIGKPFREALPELAGQGFYELVDKVYASGESIVSREMPITLDRGSGNMVDGYFNFIYQPLFSKAKNVDGILIFGYEITEMIEARNKVEDAEQRSRLAIEAANIGTFNWDMENGIFLSSPRLIEIFGFKKDEHVTHTELISRFHPEDKLIRDRAVAEAATKGSLAYEARVIRDDGSIRWVSVYGKIIHSGTKELSRMYGTALDITEQRTISQKLEQQIYERTKELDELNKQLVIKNNIFVQAEENALIGSYAWNLETGELEYSDNLFRLFGFEPNEFVPTFEKYLSMIHPDDKEQVIRDGEETITTKILAAHTYRIIANGGKLKHFRSTGKFFGTGENTMLIGTVQDISQDNLLNEILRTKNLELEQSNAELESFNYIASHDLQEPLRKIQAFSQRILSKEGDQMSAFSKDYFTRINTAAERMQNLIDALLSYSKANISIQSKGSIDLHVLLKEVVADMQDSIDEAHAVVNISYLPVLPIIAIQVEQVFVNLLANAIKYSKPDIAPVINISATMVSGQEIPDPIADKSIKYWMISVADNGIGFEQRYEHKIFELFQRLHGSGDYIGTGIGLAICKKIMRNHRGFISAIGVPGAGSTFNIYFPAL